MSNIENITYTGRRMDPSSPVRIYWNLHRQCYSIQQGGYVVAYASRLTMRDCRFKVSAAGRARVIRSGRKNVHSYIDGHIDWDALQCILPASYSAVASMAERTGADRVSYNPFKGAHWHAGDDQRRVDSAASLILTTMVGIWRHGLQERPYVVGHGFE